MLRRSLRSADQTRGETERPAGHGGIKDAQMGDSRGAMRRKGGGEEEVWEPLEFGGNWRGLKTSVTPKQEQVPPGQGCLRVGREVEYYICLPKSMVVWMFLFFSIFSFGDIIFQVFQVVVGAQAFFPENMIPRTGSRRQEKEGKKVLFLLNDFWLRRLIGQQFMILGSSG